MFRPPVSPRLFARLKTTLFLLCLVPLLSLVYGLLGDSLGANPIEALSRGLGDWTLRFLLITLLVTPLRRFTGLNWLPRLRRMLGLYTFFYALLHFMSYVWLDQFFDWAAIGKDIVKRPFITVGFASFLLLIPLAATSTNAMIKRLGGQRWRALHRAIYLIAGLAVLHYWWMVKKDITQPAIYAAVLALLLGLRVYWAVRRGGR
ncbi:MAG: sulfoxide reductase heme-binding subunit YedZ [Hydrogenophilales bacterium CG_4_10_14_3_um_filter_63_21]|nr:MAG: sulfoxide reductase heme-binding subunit YedZ [Hydrogenophilales bacterium CG_4_10_14_3_um_filter_63_21]